jgi:hypothetical protein
VGGFLTGDFLRIEDVCELIRQRATIDLGNALYRETRRHMFSVAFFYGGRPWITQIRNFDVVEGRAGKLSIDFRTVAYRLKEDVAVETFPRGTRADRLMWSYGEQLFRRRAKPDQFMKLLATVNRRTARWHRADGRMSEHCTVTYLPSPIGQPFKTERYFLPKGISPPQVRSLVLGVDTSEVFRALVPAFVEKRTVDADELREITKNAARKKRLI